VYAWAKRFLAQELIWYRYNSCYYSLVLLLGVTSSNNAYEAQSFQIIRSGWNLAWLIVFKQIRVGLRISWRGLDLWYDVMLSR